MPAATTNIQLTREQIDELRAAVTDRMMAQRTVAALLPDARDATTSAHRLVSLDVVLEAALDRINWLERTQWHSGIRDRLAAHTAYPNEAA